MSGFQPFLISQRFQIVSYDPGSCFLWSSSDSFFCLSWAVPISSSLPPCSRAEQSAAPHTYHPLLVYTLTLFMLLLFTKHSEMEVVLQPNKASAARWHVDWSKLWINTTNYFSPHPQKKATGWLFLNISQFIRCVFHTCQRVTEAWATAGQCWWRRSGRLALLN